jgi:hypothetical protein
LKMTHTIPGQLQCLFEISWRRHQTL